MAGLLEVVWAVGLKYVHGFDRPLILLITVAGMIASVWLLAIAMKSLPLGTAYAIWVGIGTVGAFIAGIILFGETLTWLRATSILLVLLGLAGLKVATT